VCQLHRAEEKLSGVLDSIDNVVWSLSADTARMLYLNPAAERVYGRPVADFIATPALWVAIVHPEDRQRALGAIEGLRENELLVHEYRIVWPDGSIRWVEDRARMICDADGTPLRIDGVSSDITERKRQAERIVHQANHDALTGLPNRNLLNDRLAQALSQARRDQQHVALLFLDLDGFKFVNDSYGHPFGDALLRSVAARLSALVRETDTIARLGGDEFVILLPSLAHGDDAEHVAGKILDAFAMTMFADGRDLHLSASIGLSVFPRDGDSGELLLQHADTAMYRAKANGRNRCESYSDDMGAQAQQRMQLEIELRLALEREQLSLHYQPQIDSASGRTVGVEALLRWNHPTLGMVPPSKFIPLAEDTGLIIPISEWVLRSACAQARAWHRAGHELVVAVNLSPRHLQQRDIPTLVREVLAATGLPAHFLELELTESALIQDTEAAVQAMRDIKALGVRLALDDFGTGYSSLSYLKRFPIDVLKIDQSFTFDVTHDEGAASITRAIIAMAQSLKMTTVAEGVETQAQRDLLIGWGCDTLQGYHISRPLPVPALTPWLEAQRQAAASMA
jgi:diguanylate cyclase (GGDEF)-like protein/PAS domain S-box-containing protein